MYEVIRVGNFEGGAIGSLDGQQGLLAESRDSPNVRMVDVSDPKGKQT